MVHKFGTDRRCCFALWIRTIFSDRRARLRIIFYSLIYLLKKRGRQADRRQTDVVASLWYVAIG